MYKVGDIVYVNGDFGIKIKSKIAAEYCGEYICFCVDETIAHGSNNITILVEEHMKVLREYGVPEDALGKYCVHSTWGLWQSELDLGPCNDQQEIININDDSGGFNLL